MKYERDSSGYSTCQFIEQIGIGNALHENARLIRIHDGVSKADSQIQLA
jgi:hypothetical protein